jgi:hypothetical protein
MRSFLSFALLVLGGFWCMSCRTTHTTPVTGAASAEEQIAEVRGWSFNLKRGHEIIQELEAFSPKELATVRLSAYRGERVAFWGGPASEYPNDLITEGGYYLRIIVLGNKDLTPCKAIWWEVIVCGKIVQVRPQNKIIVIEVNEEDWQFVASG